jgi:hypothetical protein
MLLHRTWLGLFLLASGGACGYAFLMPLEPVSVSRVVLHDDTTPTMPIFTERNLEVDFEHADSASNGTSSGEPKEPAPAALASTGTQDLGLALQTELARAGCYAGPVDGKWDQRSKNAMKEFLDRVNAKLPVDQPDPALLGLARNGPDALCGRNGPLLAVGAQVVTEAIPTFPASPVTANPPGAMGLGGPLMRPIGTITEGEESVRSVVVAPSALQQVENPPARIRSSARARPQRETRSLFQHPLGF